MTRRNLVQSAAGAGLMAAAGSAAAASAKPGVIELRYYRMRNGAMMQRTTNFLSKSALPAAKRAGFGPVGYFAPIVAEQSPFILSMTSFPSLAAMETAQERLSGDRAYLAAADEYNAPDQVRYVRMESSLLRAFKTMPGIEVPPARQGSRVFEMRIYESDNYKTLDRKVAMFDNGEIAIFRKVGMAPVFFGETMIGSNQPNLTYMLAFDDMAAREKAWSTFGSDPEWQKLRATPGLSDAEVVTNISNSLLRPLPFSEVK